MKTIRNMVLRYGFLITVHADEESREEGITLQDLHTVIENGEIIEDYPEHKRGPCCLICAEISESRHLHTVITTEKIPPRIITVYEPKPPYWITPKKRRQSR